MTQSIFSSSIHIINHPIPNKVKILENILKMKEQEFAESQNMGICYLDNSLIYELFQYHLKQYGVKVRILRGWAHFMAKGSSRPSHQHTTITGIYYIKIPNNSAKLQFDDTGEGLPPVEDDFIMFDKMRPHSISRHNNEELRWAIGFECELIGKI